MSIPEVPVFRVVTCDSDGEGKVYRFATQIECDAFVRGYCVGANDHGGGGSWAYSEDEVPDLSDDIDQETVDHLRALLAKDDARHLPSPDAPTEAG